MQPMYVFSDVYVRVKYILLEIFRFPKSEFWHFKHRIFYVARFLNKYIAISLIPNMEFENIAMKNDIFFK